jgi:nicotinate-nucleotide adenylyltransferase
MKQIGFFGGSFDPIHFGHINLAIEIFEKADLDEIIFCPNNVSPHKIKSPPIASPIDRYNMVKIVIDDIKHFSVCDFEVQRKEASYTIDTLRFLEKKYKDKAQIRLIIGKEALPLFHTWKDYKEILKIAPPIIGYRSNFSEIILKNELKEMSIKNFIMNKSLDISSTDIRSRLKTKSYCSHLVPSKVLDYIYEHRLY